MALSNIVFEPPEFGDGRQSDDRPVDLAHLAKQTAGDRKLENLLLSDFTKQARESLATMADCSKTKRGKLATEISKAAEAIGAFDMAEKARKVKANPTDPICLAAFSNAVVKTSTFVASLNRV